MRYLRLKKKKEFSSLLKGGRRAFSETLTVVYLRGDALKMAVCVGKRYGKSVQRNRIKRLLRAAFSQYAECMEPCSVLLIPKVSEQYAYASFARDIGKILKRERLFKT